MRILLDENGYIKEWAMCPKEKGHICLENGIEVDDIVDVNDIEAISKFYLEFQSYHMVNGILIKDENKMEEILIERQKDKLRNMRETQCFSIVNRGAAWYNTLTDKQAAELTTWYRAWLDVTDTLLIPERPDWIY
jgi:hypothetical protein